MSIINNLLYICVITSMFHLWNRTLKSSLKESSFRPWQPWRTLMELKRCRPTGFQTIRPTMFRTNMTDLLKTKALKCCCIWIQTIPILWQDIGVTAHIAATVRTGHIVLIDRDHLIIPIIRPLLHPVIRRHRPCRQPTISSDREHYR